jgi:DNA-binding MarR family transcriptional regulator
MNYTKPNDIPPLRILSPIHKATRRIADHLATRATSGDLSVTEAHLLSYLRSYGPCPLGRVIAVFGLKKSTLTGVVDRLVGRGLATRDLNPDDRRSFLVGLTAAGRSRADGVRAALDQFEREVTARLTDGDLRGFANVLDAITQVTAPVDSEGDRS